jgi:hypothetical protein
MFVVIILEAGTSVIESCDADVIELNAFAMNVFF